MYKGEDYSTKLTINHLICQTSGLPDIFEEGWNPLIKRAIDRDLEINLAEVIMETKKLKPNFAPNLDRRAHYTDVNFDLLGEIIEIVEGEH